jgi:hypothetical protein
LGDDHSLRGFDMTGSKAEASGVSFVDNPHSPEIFADEACGFFVHNGVVRITFCAARCDHSMSPGPLNRVVNGRVVIPLANAQALALGLLEFLKKAAPDPTQATSAGHTMQ